MAVRFRRFGKPRDYCTPLTASRARWTTLGGSFSSVVARYQVDAADETRADPAVVGELARRGGSSLAPLLGPFACLPCERARLGKRVGGADHALDDRTRSRPSPRIRARLEA